MKQLLSIVSLWLALAALAQAEELQLYFVHNDHLGTPVVVTDSTQTVVWQAEKTPFGETTETINSIEQPLRFPGQYFDRETGLHYNYYRDYDPSLGRYIQSDPIGILEDFSNPSLKLSLAMGSFDFEFNSFPRSSLNHLYGYARQNPLKYSDPSGLLSELECLKTPWCAMEMYNVSKQTAKALAAAGALGASASALKEICDEDIDENCEALYQSTLATCASLTGRKKFKCFEAARENREQCYQERGK